MKQLFRSPILYIFLLGLLLRLYSLGTNPAGFFRDEAAKGYNAYCLWNTGHDIDGHFLPLFTRELATYNSALYSYLIIPFIAILGLTETAVRLPAALIASLTILSTYWLVLQLYDKRIAILAAFFLAVSPWQLVFSRWANQGILLPFFITFGLGCFWRYIYKEKKNYWIYLSLIIFALSFYTYDITKVFIPLLLLGLLIIYRKELSFIKSTIGLVLLLFFIIAIPMLNFTFLSNYASQGRFQRISIFTLPYSPSHIAFLFLKNWTSHYSPYFLFSSGDANIRHSMHLPFMGQLYLCELPLILTGIYFLWKKRNKINMFLFYWLVIYPISASLTAEGIPHALRSICVIPLFSILSAMGLIQIIDYFRIDFSGSIKQKRQWVFAVFLFLIIFNISMCLIGYYRKYPVMSAKAFQYGMKPAVQYAEAVKGKYDNIIVSPSLEYPEIFFLFYTHQIPTVPYRFNASLDEVRNYLYAEKTKNLFLVTPDELMEFSPPKVILLPDGKPALKFVSNIGMQNNQMGH